LRSLHVTGGYREGIAVSKEKHMQEGFDEGYTLGAELGLKAGWCLGALEGVGHALAASTVSQPTAEKTSDSDQNDLVSLDSTRELLESAEEELKVENLFGRTYFGEDGIWLYRVPGQEREDEETTFEKIAAAHPLAIRRVGGWADVASRRGIINGFKRRAEDLFGLLVVVEASEITTSGLKCLLRSNFTLPQLQASTRESLMNAILAEREHKGPTLKSVDMSFRLVNLPPEVQTKIVEFAVYQDRVIGLDPPAEHPEPQAKKRRSLEATAEISPPEDGTKSMKADTAADSGLHCGSCKSVSALEKAQDGMPVSAMRSTVQKLLPGESIYPNANVQKQCTNGAELLCKIQAPAQSATTIVNVSQFKAALKFMQGVLACFPPKEDLPGTVSAVERIFKTLEQWDQDGSYEVLLDAIDGAVNGNPDLLLDFQGFLPENRRTVGMSELWKVRIERLGFDKTKTAKQ
ncbi:hypothetical protein KC352_g25920, partial [Hortaea werneckii]